MNSEQIDQIRPRTAARTRGIPPSATLALSQDIAAAAAQGRNLLNLAGGDPDADTPPHIVDAAVRALRSGRTHYAPGRGTPELRAAIAEAASLLPIERNPDTEVLVTGSAKLALATALDALVDPGDEVVLLAPAWVSYAPLVELRGGTPVELPLSADDGYRLTADALRAVGSHKTVAVIVNTPCNPTGHVLDEGEVAAVAQVARERDWTIISDEVYARLILDGEHRSPAVAAPERTIVVDGVSKGFAMTGWRLGWLHGPADLVGAAALVFGHTVSCAPTFVQDAAVVALTAPESAPAVNAMVEVYRRRRAVMLQELSGCPGVRIAAPQGAFYLFPDVSGTGLDGTGFSRHLLAAADVAVLPGVAFGEAFADHVRLSLATPDDLLLEGVRRMKAQAAALTAVR
ncbi:pyridoxal phosphate-dependent aminotransferase [Amycolatopsis sp. GM8]|uniref:pyridoxal phosphate-dependent aminotransferase n=1 Tax=Amycolatopsis sp. GM8 TaxID=2896530 RepID=UPI001F1741C7|nr:pyridoxal phosphate-dependent aminotransferase [Amycolatopsis sp. GM8]